MPRSGSNGRTRPPSRALIQRGFLKPRIALGLCDIGRGCDRLVFDVDPLVVGGCPTRALIVAPLAGRPLGCQRSDVQPLAQKVNALEIAQPLEQPSDPVVDRAPGPSW